MKTVAAFLMVSVLIGCSAEKKVDSPELADVMPVVPLPPDSRSIGSAGSDEALQFTFLSEHKQEDMITYYRRMFTSAPWTLISDAKGPDGAVILYVENDGTPLWVKIARTAGAPGSTIQLSGALISGHQALIDSLSAASDSQ